MISKKIVLDLTELLAVGSITTAGYLIGGTVGASVMAGLGINLASTIVGNGSTNLKSRWLKSKDGILNHDIQRALLRAYVKSLSNIKDCYFQENDKLAKNEKKQISQLIESLTETATLTFIPDIQKSIQLTEITEYLYGNQSQGEELLQKRIFSTNCLDDYDKKFRNYFLSKILPEIKFWFGEELKTDSIECNKAWRAFQRLLLEGIKDELTSIKSNQEEVKSDLIKLSKIEMDIAELAKVVEKRFPNEPFQDKIIVDKLPEAIKTLIDKASDLWTTGDYEKSKELFEKALKTSNNLNNNLGIAKAKRGIAGNLMESERKSSEAMLLLKESLKLFRNEKSDKDVINVLCSLGGISTDIGHFDKASSYLTEAHELAIKVDDKIETAHVFHRFGWLEDHKGNSDNSIDYYSKSQSIYFTIFDNTDDAKIRKEAAWGIGGCYHLKGLVYRHKGEVINVISNFKLAFEWYEKENLKPEMAKILYLLSETHFREADYDKGYELLNQSKKLYSELELIDWVSRCHELSAKVYNTLGKRDEAENEIKQAFVLSNSSGNSEQQVNYLIDLGIINIEKNKIEESKNYFQLAKEISYNKEYFEDFATCVKNLAEIASIEKKEDERKSQLLEGIKALEKYLLTIQAKPKQGFIFGRIGMFYELLFNNEQAISFYQKAKKIFEEINDIGGIANSLGAIAGIKRKREQTNEEFDIYRELKTLLEGTPFYDLKAGTAINLGEIYMELGNLNEAKILLDEALSLCKKYNLHVKKHLDKSMQRLSENENLRKPPELDLHQLIDELFELVNWFPEAKDSIFRLWMWARQNELLSNYRITHSVKYMVCQDDIAVFDKLAQKMKPFGDLFLQVVSCKFPETALDIVPFPMDKTFFFDVDFPTVKL